MKYIFLFPLSILFICQITAKADDRIYETKHICGRYYAAEINGREAALLLGLSGSGRVGSRVEQYCNFFR
tara:strand:+ start:31 stop:240 length:210 start_codon:yes stop_codon:yes gene_type:complete